MFHVEQIFIQFIYEDMLLKNLAEDPVMKCKDHTVSGKEFFLKYNWELDLMATFPRPDSEQLSQFYQSEKYISHTDSRNTFFDKIYHWVKNYMLNKKLNWIAEHKKEGTILDLGAGTGSFLARAKDRHWEIYGVEPIGTARELAFKKGIPLYSETKTLQSNFFDVITLWHVLEHVPDLEKQIRELKRLLKDEGLLVIAVPNFKSYDAQKYKENWAAYDVPRHLWHFSRTAVQKVFGHYGFQIIGMKPLIFDAFYVSLLSEKYKAGSGNPLAAFFTGLISNFKARRTREHSSVVYFLKNEQ